MKPRFFSPAAQLELVLNTSYLSEQTTSLWLAFLRQALSGLDRSWRIQTTTHQIPDLSEDYALISSSLTLSRKLLANLPRIYLVPDTVPKILDPWLYYRLINTTEFAALSFQPRMAAVTLVSSIFRGDEFLAGFLENSAKLVDYADCEHLLIRAGSPGHEHARLLEYVRQQPTAVYINLAHDPGLYEVWNLGCLLATGRYLSNANIDDRRAPDQVQHLKQVLDSQPEVAVGSTALRISTEKNLSWENSDACRVWFGDLGSLQAGGEGLFADSGQGLVSRNLPHCMPLWRRSLHGWVGDFDESRYGPSADWAFWLKAATRGAKFHLSAEPKGLYLRDQNSYWRRNAVPGTVSAHDKGIVDEFGWLARREQPNSDLLIRPFSLELSVAIRKLRGGAVLEGLAYLLESMCLQPVGVLDSAAGVLNWISEHFIGCRNWAALRSDYARLLGVDRELALCNALVNLIHEFDPKVWPEAETIARSLEWAALDWLEWMRDAKGMILLALLAGKKGDDAREQLLLKRAYRQDGSQFWGSVQAGYRFSRRLPDLCRQVAAMDVMPLSENAADLRLLYYPDYSRTNAYQTLLYASWRNAGAVIRGTSDEIELFNARYESGRENVLHVHWVNPIFGRGLKRNEIEQRSRSFLNGLREQQGRGFKIYWTIHNRLSHDSNAPELELAFQKDLYRLADRVFVHHPLAVEFLDWLPDREKLGLCEHGAYPVTNNLSKLEARRVLDLNPQAFLLTHVGQVREYKGLSSILPTLLDLLEALPRLTILIAGRISSDSVKAWLIKHSHPRILVRDRFLSDEELNACMLASDAGFLSYDNILTSGTLAHWLSYGRPVVSPKNGTIPAYVVDGWNGFSYRNPHELAKRVSYLVGTPEQELVSLAMNAEKTALNFSWGFDRHMQHFKLASYNQVNSLSDS